jgi:hypothetical protein
MFAYGGVGQQTGSRLDSERSTGSDKKKRRQSSHSSAAKSTSQYGGEDDRQSKQSSRPTTQLRTASRAPKRYSQSTSRKPAESVEEVKARAAHNQVEQQYRKRLNAQFERLLAVLPQQEYEEDGFEGSEGADGGKLGLEKRISKAEVLDLARRRIKTLERERASLETQKDELVESVERMQDEWSRRLGNGGVQIKRER